MPNRARPVMMKARQRYCSISDTTYAGEINVYDE